MASNNSINLVDLDFQSIKASLKNTLRDNPLFRDYDFEDSNMNMLIELLAINGYRTAFYQNMVLNESFLDSAILRNSVLSRCKELNYLPSSAKSARARIKVSFEASGANAPYLVAKGSLLSSSIRNDTYTFSIPSNITVASANNTYEFETDIYEGYYVSDTYTYVNGTEGQTFQITNRNVDIDSLTVTVYEDGNTVGDLYSRRNTLLDINNTDKVFFIEPTGVGYYNVLFGDGNIGRRPKGDSTIVLNYRITNGAEANGARRFSLDFDPTSSDELTSTVTVDVLQGAVDGANEETLESMKYNAPRHFQTQERAVTHDDYESILRSHFPEIRAIHAYGGEDLNPPMYGRVYISTDLANVDGLPDSKVQAYKKFLKNRTTFGIVPVFVEPNYTYIKVKSLIRYNINTTNDTEENIKTYVKNAIRQYREDNLNDFDVIFRESSLLNSIVNSDPAIISTVTDTWIYKKINPPLGTLYDFTIDFGVPLYQKLGHAHNFHPFRTDRAVASSTFYYKSELVTIEDDGFGALRILRLRGDAYEKIDDIGTVDYNTGVINVQNLKVDSYTGQSIRFYCKPRDPDIVAELNNIVTIEDDEIELTIEGLSQ